MHYPSQHQPYAEEYPVYRSDIDHPELTQSCREHCLDRDAGDADGDKSGSYKSFPFGFKYTGSQYPGDVASETKQGRDYCIAMYSKLVQKGIEDYSKPWQVTEVFKEAQSGIEGYYIWEDHPEFYI